MNNYEKKAIETSQENIEDRKGREENPLDNLDENRREEASVIENIKEEMDENDNKEQGGIMKKLAGTYRDNKLLQAAVVGLNLVTIAPEVEAMAKISGIDNPVKMELKIDEADIKRANETTEALLTQIKTGKVDGKLLDEQMTRTKTEQADSGIEEKEIEVEEEGASGDELYEAVTSVLNNEKYPARLTENLGENKVKAEGYIEKLKKWRQEVTKPKGQDWYSEEENMKKSKESYALQAREDLLKHIEGDVYLDKLAIEFDGDIDKAREEQEKRIEAIKNTEINTGAERTLEEIYERIKRQKEGNLPKNMSEEKRQKVLADTVEHHKKSFLQKEVDGFSIDDDGQKIYIFKDSPGGVQFEDTARHEFLHSATEGTTNISQKAKKILDKSFQPNYGNRKEYEMTDYLSNTSERLVRKQQLDTQLEEYGVKKYEEKFTRKHYDIMMQLYNMKAFSDDVGQFIRTTNPDFETFKEIFNEIAENEDGSKKQNANRENIA